MAKVRLELWRVCSKVRRVCSKVQRVCSKVQRVCSIFEGVQHFGGCVAFWRVCSKFGTLGGCVVRFEGV